MKKLAVLLGLLSCGLATNVAFAEVRDPLGPWEVLGPDYQASDPLDLSSYEWEYFTIQNEDDSFVGIIGYVLADPREAAQAASLWCRREGTSRWRACGPDSRPAPSS